jgi:hypothetical protein
MRLTRCRTVPGIQDAVPPFPIFGTTGRPPEAYPGYTGRLRLQTYISEPRGDRGLRCSHWQPSSPYITRPLVGKFVTGDRKTSDRPGTARGNLRDVARRSLNFPNRTTPSARRWWVTNQLLYTPHDHQRKKKTSEIWHKSVPNKFNKNPQSK